MCPVLDTAFQHLIAANSHNAGYYAARMGQPLNPCAPVEWQNGWYAYGSEQLTTEQLQQGQEASDRG